MKLLKTVPAAVMLAGGFLRLLAQWPMILYLPSWMTLPLLKNLSKVWLTQATWRSPATPKNSSMTADSTLTWYGNTTAWSLWGMPATPLPTMSDPQKNMQSVGVAATT